MGVALSALTIGQYARDTLAGSIDRHDIYSNLPLTSTHVDDMVMEGLTN